MKIVGESRRRMSAEDIRQQAILSLFSSEVVSRPTRVLRTWVSPSSSIRSPIWKKMMRVVRVSSFFFFKIILKKSWYKFLWNLYWFVYFFQLTLWGRHNYHEIGFDQINVSRHDVLQRFILSSTKRSLRNSELYLVGNLTCSEVVTFMLCLGGRRRCE